ncbi:hypothetical protein G5B38_19990 (plasmid) [Pseudohalocynthiibacter aestuariivivens]|nr:hypothetical protein G5B38_19990 [Pseudohalocynthiibacter aestuariivivens]
MSLEAAKSESEQPATCPLGS